MGRLIILLIILTLSSCTHQGSSTDNSAKKDDNFQNTFATCFAHMDTSKSGQSIGCTGRAYKLINDKYVIRIYPNLPIQFDSCTNITIDSLNGKLLTELLIFDSNNASFTNICTDIIITNFAKPARYLYAQSGQIIIGFSPSTDLYNNTYRTTVFIKTLVFIDSKSREKIELKNELLWKVLDTSTPG